MQRSSELSFGSDRTLVDAVFLDDLAVVEHVKLLCCVLACKEHDRFLTPRVVW